MTPIKALAPLVVALAASGCGGGAGESSGIGEGEGPAGHPDADLPRTEDTIRGDCEVGARPDYFVPGGSAVVIGCAVLGVSGMPVELSIQEKPGTCINPAYGQGGRRGIYIPAICSLEPVPERLDVVDASVPRQAVRGYELVIWGTVPGGSDVVARSAAGPAEAAVFPVGPPVAGEVKTERPFSVFAVELPVEAACEEITIAMPGAAGGTAKVDGRPHLCARRR